MLVVKTSTTALAACSGSIPSALSSPLHSLICSQAVHLHNNTAEQNIYIYIYTHKCILERKQEKYDKRDRESVQWVCLKVSKQQYWPSWSLSTRVWTNSYIHTKVKYRLNQTARTHFFVHCLSGEVFHLKAMFRVPIQEPNKLLHCIVCYNASKEFYSKGFLKYK